MYHNNIQENGQKMDELGRLLALSICQEPGYQLVCDFGPPVGAMEIFKTWDSSYV